MNRVKVIAVEYLTLLLYFMNASENRVNKYSLFLPLDLIEVLPNQAFTEFQQNEFNFFSHSLSLSSANKYGVNIEFYTMDEIHNYYFVIDRIQFKLFEYFH